MAVSKPSTRSKTILSRRSQAKLKQEETFAPKRILQTSLPVINLGWQIKRHRPPTLNRCSTLRVYLHEMNREAEIVENKKEIRNQ